MDDESGEIERFQLRCPVDLYNKLQLRMKKTRRSMNAEIVWCLETYLDEQEKIAFVASLDHEPESAPRGSGSMSAEELAQFLRDRMDQLERKVDRFAEAALPTPRKIFGSDTETQEHPAGHEEPAPSRPLRKVKKIGDQADKAEGKA